MNGKKAGMPSDALEKIHFTDLENKFMIKKHEQIIDKEFDLVFNIQHKIQSWSFQSFFPSVFSPFYSTLPLISNCKNEINCIAQK